MMQNPEYVADVEALISKCQERQVAIQTIKSLARGPWEEKPRTHTTWYEPMDEQSHIDRAVHWVLGRPGIFLNTSGDVTLLPKILDAASRFEATPPEAEMQETADKLSLEPLFTAERTGP